MNPNKLSNSKACYKNALEQYDSIDFDKKLKLFTIIFKIFMYGRKL